VEYKRIASASLRVWAAAGEIYGASFVVHWTGRRWQTWRMRGMWELAGLAVVGDRDVWVAGLTAPSAPLVLHWNGRDWRRVPFPLPGAETFLPEDLDVTPQGTAWLAGERPAEHLWTSALAARWDGTRWSIVYDALLAEPYASDGSDLTAISAADGDRAWLGGDAFESLPGNEFRAFPLTLLLDAQKPMLMMPPLPLVIADTFLDDVAAVDATTAWVVGGSVEDDGTDTPFIERVECAA
jgi:hypothetical protein